jgi:hypothetical protein
MNFQQKLVLALMLTRNIVIYKLKKMGKFFIKLGKKIIEFNEFLKSKWNSLMYKLMFKKEQK